MNSVCDSSLAWLASCQGVCPPRPLDRVRAVILASDHGVSHDRVSAYPRAVTAVMVLGVVGSLLGTFVGRALWGGPDYSSGWITAILGTIVVLAIYRAVKGRQTT